MTNLFYYIILYYIIDSILLLIIMLRNILSLYRPKVGYSRNSDTIYALATGVGTAVSVNNINIKVIRVGGQHAYRTL